MARMVSVCKIMNTNLQQLFCYISTFDTYIENLANMTLLLHYSCSIDLVNCLHQKSQTVPVGLREVLPPLYLTLDGLTVNHSNMFVISSQLLSDKLPRSLFLWISHDSWESAPPVSSTATSVFDERRGKSVCLQPQSLIKIRKFGYFFCFLLSPKWNRAFGLFGSFGAGGYG